MAIPISWPSAEDVEDSYRSLDLLLEQLLLTIRQVLVQRRRQQVLATLPSRQRTSVPQPGAAPSVPEPASPIVNHPRLPLPDLVPESADCESPRPRKSALDAPVASQAQPASTWTQTGAELRHIADTFRADRGTDQHTVDGKSTRVKEASLLSLICPGLGSSLWTTVALLVGWGLFSRTR